MRATAFEFRYRFWLFFLTYLVGFGCYRFDHVDATEALVRWIFASTDPRLDSVQARHAFQTLLFISAGIVATAAWIRTWAGAYMRTEVVHDVALHTNRLVADGPYRRLRNPLYLGTLLLGVGLAMLASRIGAVVIILGAWLIVARLIGREEAALVESQGEPYRAFLAAVPSLWPSLRPRLPAGGMETRWLHALLGEAWLWIFALNGMLLAWTLDGRRYRELLWAPAVAYFLAWILVKHLRKQSYELAESGKPFSKV